MERSPLSRLLGAYLFTAMVFAVLGVLAPFTASASFLDGPSIKDKLPAPVSPIGTTVTENIPDKLDAAYQNIRWEIIGTGTMAFMNAMQTFFGQVAYDAADYLATGGKGQSALYYKKGFQEYLLDVGGSAAGEFIGSISQSTFFQTAGFDLCRPPDPKTLLRIQLSLGQFLPNGTTPAYQRPQARCDFNNVVQNYEQVYQTLSNGDVLKNVDASLNTNANDLGVSFLIFNRAQEFVYRRQEASEKDRKEGNGYQGLRDIISGRIRTPSDTIREEANQITVKDPKANQEQINSFILNQAWNLGPIRLATYTASVFLNTFTSRMLGRIFEDGIDSFDPFKQRILASVNNADDLLTGSAEDIRKANIDLRTPNLFQDRSYDVISEMQSCPEVRGTWNCTIDEGLAQSLHSEGETGAFTIQEALDRGYLKASWRLFPSSNLREESDPLCYTYGYCAGNLRKLRLMRVIPVGFEFAANDTKNVERCSGDQGCVTLGEVVSGFSVCNAQGQKDNDHPWCKLIDPNWALTLLPQQCALTGFGNIMLGAGLPQRREECQDIQTCLRRNDAGQCVGGYGQCVAEKAVYRFGGEECSARYASCRSYSARQGGEQVSYLRNTLDYAQCSADNVGCMWYATKRDPNATTASAWVATPTDGDKIYFDKTMESCEASGEGCTKLLAVREGEKALNLVANSSFEIQGTGNTLQSWAPLSGTDRGFARPTLTGTASADGEMAAGFAGGFIGGYRQVLDLQPGHNYVLSGFVRRAADGGVAPTLRLGIRQFLARQDALTRTAPLTETTLRRNFRTTECLVVSSSGDFSGATILAQAETAAQSTTWSRVQCSFTADATANAGEILIQGTNAVVDAIMLEEGTVAGRYIDGLNQSLETVYHKIAPPEFKCTGEATDPAGCASYAKVCRQTEAGCNGYTDASGAFPEVAAQLGGNDACPAVCVGYAEYRKLASAFDLVQSSEAAANDASEPRAAYFIPSTAEQCTQDAVGCEEFTAVDAAADGGEDKAYFNSLRYCEKPSNDTATYFTWEGSDSAGYQLRTWSLMKRTDVKPGELPPAPESSVIGANPGPRIVVKRSGDLFSQKDPQACNESNWRTGSDGDCRQFYDAAGTVFYRYYSQTVLSTNDCRAYRVGGSSEDDCTKTGGQYQTEQRTCTYQAYAPESGSCSANFAGCRAYAGAEAGNIRSVFVANGTVNPAVTGATVSSESLLVGDTSYRVDAAAGRTATINAGFSSANNNLYRVSFWIKASTPATAVLNASTVSGENPRLVGTIRLTSEWQQVNLGLFEGATGDKTRLSWTISAGQSAPAALFLDEINVQQLRDVVFVRQNTWQTPAQCDQTPYGIPEPQAMLGCREYRGRDGTSVYARQFSQLCRPQAIGCREFIDTRNSDQPYRQAFTLNDLSGPAVTEHAAARYVYVIDDISRRCDASNASCTAFGKPVFTVDRRAVDRYETVYLKDDVTKYGDGLCKPSELFCEEFSTAGGQEYFKDPQNHACEYRDQVTVTSVAGVPDGTYNGWFIKGKNEPCYPNALAAGQTFQILRTGDTSPTPGYLGWGATCPVEQNECTEFRDPNERSASAPTGKAYYFINNDSIDTSSCNGSVDPAHGCVLLRNMSSSRLLYSTEATLKAYQANKLRPVAAVNCQSDPSQPGCSGVQTGRCVGTRVTQRYALNAARNGVVIDASLSAPYAGGSCAQDSDCTNEARRTTSGQLSYSVGGGALTIQQTAPANDARVDGIRCERPSLNDANEVVKVSLDRDCAEWLGCATGETVYDPSSNQLRDICTKFALCQEGGEQNGSGAAYCSSYVNRTSTSTEPILTSGAYFGAQQYTTRPLTVNARDYSGYTIPNAFQVVDLQSRSIAEDVPALKLEKEKTNQRLVVAVKMPPIDPATIASGDFQHSVPPTSPNQAEAIRHSEPISQSVGAGIDLCRHRGTGMIGYFLREDALRSGQQINCYLSFRGTQEANAFTALSNRLASNQGQQDLALDQNYPKALCRAYPESDAPFSSDVVTKWDLTTNPISPIEVKQGYTDANICAYGEDCSCSYKRVEYPGLIRPKFFEAESEAVPPGICVGGPRAGQSCLPSDVFNISSSTSTSAQAAQAANNAQTCGDPNGGGQCVAFGKAEIVRGIMGSCLEYDTTNGTGRIGDQTFPCLVWNPSPILGGENDPYHYVQTAAYFPPQNAGQYYCTSKAKTPAKYRMSASDFSALPSGVTVIDYHDSFTSDGSGKISSAVSRVLTGSFAAVGGGRTLEVLGSQDDQPGAYFEGQRPSGSNAATQCEDADDDQDDDGNYQYDPLGLRIVATGRGQDSSYTETFYTLGPKSYAGWLYNTSPDSTSAEQRQQAMNEQNISYIEVKPFVNPNGNGRLACGYQEDWVDGVHVSDYDSLDETGPADRQWQQAFLGQEDLRTYLTRGAEEVLLSPTQASRPLKMPCVNTTDGSRAGDEADVGGEGQCYFKTWEIGYRANGQKTFVGFDRNVGDSQLRDRTSGGFDSLRNPVYEQCTSDKPYYAIRAVFQTDAAGQSIAPDQINARDIRGPWRLVGFWVSACGGRAQTDNRFIYMNVTIQNADICKQLAEVRSVDTHQDAAFTDRVWRESKYSVPILGIQYNQSFAPFSSALNTGPAGEDPLYQTGGKLAGSSAIRPPTFLASAYQTYYGPIVSPGMPRDRYAYLSNLFARIYRVYHFNEQQIKREDKVCVGGPNEGRKCVPDSAAGATTVPEFGPSVDCRALTASGACDTTVPPPPTTKVCNALSGINRGLTCGAQPEVCHSYALNPDPQLARPRPLLTACIQNPTESERATRPFRCAAGAIRLASSSVSTDAINDDFAGPNSSAGTIYCSQASDNSAECPLEVVGTCQIAPGGAPGSGQCRVTWQGLASPMNTAISCTTNADCSFDGSNFWKAPTAATIPTYTITVPRDNWIISTGQGNEFDGHRGGIVSLQNPPLPSVQWSTDRSPYQIPAWSACGSQCNTTTIATRLGAIVTRNSADIVSYPGAVGVAVPNMMRMINCAGVNFAPGATLTPQQVELCSRYPQLSCESLPAGDQRNTCYTNPREIDVGGQASYTVGGCESLTSLIGEHSDQLQLGTCSEGALRPGSVCIKPVQGATLTSPYDAWAAGQTCGTPPVVPGADVCTPVSTKLPNGDLIPAVNERIDCRLTNNEGQGQTAGAYYLAGNVAAADQDLNNDNNACSAEVGYQPDRKICPDPTNEFCGLIAYDMRASGGAIASLDNRDKTVPLPTDVTLGHYTPAFLGFNQLPQATYEYIDYYTPRPPRIAAPVAQCPTGTSCGAQSLDSFSFNGITQGIVNVVGGQYRSVIKFYGWAAHEQMALRRLSVDWGDGTVQDLDDVKLKNHKPFCSVTKECYSSTDGFTGLTCQTNNDCPLQAQACRSMGSCVEKKNLVCGQDSDCRRDGSPSDKCDIRPFFGNDENACEAAPFEFAHIYACPSNAASTLPSCSGQNRSTATDAINFAGASDVIAPVTNGRAGTCYYGAVDSITVEAAGRASCTATADCLAAYGRAFGIADTSRDSLAFPASIRNGISCGPPSVASSPAVVGANGITIPVTQARCSGDTNRYCSVNADCAAGDTCIAGGMAPPNGCWDAQNNACRFTPRVFLQDNWGWCTGECRALRVGDTLQDSPTSGVRHAFGGCYTPLSEGGNASKDATRLNSQDSSSISALVGSASLDFPNLECSINRPNGALPSTTVDPRRNYRPWIIFPGSIQLRPKS